jgi:hypothetical protein
MDHHPIMQSRDGIAAGPDEERGDYCMYEACQRGEE